MGKIDELNALGINTSDGLDYTGGDEDFYVEMLQDYVDVRDERVADLKRLYDEAAWPDYRTGVHSLKSVSRMLGIVSIAEPAYELEKASDAGDEGYLKAHHDETLKAYDDMVENIKSIIAG